MDESGSLLFYFAALVKLAEFSTTPQIKTVVTSVMRKPANQQDEWLKEVSRLLTRIYGAGLDREGPNLLPDPGFETPGAGGLPAGWKRRDYGDRPANITAAWSMAGTERDLHGGKFALRVITTDAADTSFYAGVLAARSTPAYIRESLLEPSKAIAKGFEQFTLSPMPPVADIFSPQEISDLETFLLTLK